MIIYKVIASVLLKKLAIILYRKEDFKTLRPSTLVNTPLNLKLGNPFFQWRLKKFLDAKSNNAWASSRSLLVVYATF